MQSNKVDLNKISFEEALLELENIVRELESGQIKLDDAVTAYEKAVALKKICQDKLAAATLKVEKIEAGLDGTLKTVPLDNVEA
ncbi:MAG: exodeoxyribonuclease VII small subunit [Alphaproteobacteria bacterium]|nr:exodeoxyribonuclease VII small subunit [Alphaproteobacteria bacterium]MBP3687437.1 exodeoxyribonuclease VII small subunit [Alphaproteobacteria bacterium]